MQEWKRKKLHVYDSFDDRGSNKNKLPINLRDLPQEEIFHKVIDRVCPRIRVHKGFIGRKEVSGSESWGNADVGLFAIDTAKNVVALYDQTKYGIFEKLQPGGIIFLMDMGKHGDQMLMFYSLYVLDEVAEIEFIAFGSSPWAFSVKKKLDHSKMNTWKSWVQDRENSNILSNAVKKIIEDVEKMAIVQHVSREKLTTSIIRIRKQLEKHIQYNRDSGFN